MGFDLVFLYQNMFDIFIPEQFHNSKSEVTPNILTTKNVMIYSYLDDGLNVEKAFFIALLYIVMYSSNA